MRRSKSIQQATVILIGPGGSFSERWQTVWHQNLGITHKLTQINYTIFHPTTVDAKSVDILLFVFRKVQSNVIHIG